MCTLVILRRPDHQWPVLIGANRDEMIDRPWQPPCRHWPDRPEVVAGLDALAGGSWLGVNDWGVAAAVLNRHGSLGPARGARSRGELVREALDPADWTAWESLLGSTRAPPGEPATAAMRFRSEGYGTVSSALIALPALGEPERRPIFRFAGWL